MGSYVWFMPLNNPTGPRARLKKTSIFGAAAAIAFAGLAVVSPSAHAATPDELPCVASVPLPNTDPYPSVSPSLTGWYTDDFDGTSSTCVGTIDSTYTIDTTATYEYRVRVRSTTTNDILFQGTANYDGSTGSVSGAISVREGWVPPIYVCVAWDGGPAGWSPATCLDVP